MTTSKLIQVTNNVTLISTDLNSLANGSGILSTLAVLDNTANLAMWVSFELNVTYGTNPTAGSLVSVYLVPSADGTNYANTVNGASPFVPAAYSRGAFQLQAVTTAQRIDIDATGPAGPPTLLGLKYKVYVVNSAGQAMAASGNTISASTWAVQTV